MKTLTLLLVLLVIITVNQASAQNFQVLQSGTINHLSDVSFLNDNTGFVAMNNGSILRTLNAGSIWTSQTTGSSSIIRDFFFLNDNIFFAVGTNGKIWKSVNGGINWTVTSPVSVTLNSVYFTAPEIGYTVGSSSTILKTTNGGNSWSAQSCPFPDITLTGISFVGTKGYITVAAGETNLLVSENGNIWVDSKTRQSGNLMSWSISTFVENKGYMAGYEDMGALQFKPIIFRSADNGQNWQEFSLPSKGQLYDVAVMPNNSNKACAVGRYVNDPVHGNEGLIMRTIDGGVTWTEEPLGTNEFTGVFSTNTSFYVIGKNGVILKADNTVGISNVNLEVPIGYTLSQNFPNPFNPETNIKFSISQSGNVKLTVFDITGKEVESLVNEKLSAGTYAYNFNASNLPSGTYFYKIETDNFVETKKMVLIK